MGTLFLPLTGIDPTNPIPGNVLETRFAVGDAGASQAPKRVLIFAPSLATGDIVQDTQVYGPVADEDDVTARAGAGSAAHLTWAGYQENAGQAASVFLLCPTRSAGAAATGTFTVSGSPTGTGTVEAVVGGQSAFYSFTASDTPTTIAAGLAAASVGTINALRRCPVTASNAAGVVTITAKQSGLGGNTIRYRAKSSGAGITVTATADTAMSGGATAENHTAALATIASQRFDLIVVATSDATEMGKIMTHVDTLALPANGLRQFALFGLALTPSAAGTAVAALNRVRGSWANQEECPEPSYALAGKYAGAIAANRFSNPSFNFDSYGLKSGQIFTAKRPFNDSAIPNASELLAMLTTGVTPIGVNVATNQAYIVRAVTGRSLNGAVPDFRARDIHVPFVTDAFADDLLVKLSSAPWQKLTDDVGDENALQPDAAFATPRRGKTAIEPIIRDYVARGHLDPAKEAYMIANLSVGIDTFNPGALNFRVPLLASKLLHRTATLLAEQSPNA